jgi:TP901 family phage tail tape measure protein
MADKFAEILQIAIETLGEEQAKKLEVALRSIGDAGTDVDAQISPLLDQLQKLSDQAARVGNALDLQEKLRANEAALAAAKDSFAKLNEEFDRTDKSSGSISVAFQQAEKQVKSLAAEQLKLQNASASATAALKASGVDTSKLASVNDELKAKIAAVAQQITSTATAAKQAGAGVASLGDESKRTGGILAELKSHLVEIVSFATAAGIAFKTIEFGKDAFAGAANVEQSFARVRAIAQASVDEFSALSEQIERSAAAANVSGTDAAAAAAALAEQGQSAAEIFQTLTPTLLLAKDASIDLGQAAGVVDDVLDLFGKTASDASLAVDQLVAASKGSKDGLAGMADAIRTLAPDARQLGLTFEQLTGLLGFLGQNGIDAGNSVKGLRTVFQDLQDPTSKLSIALSQLGDSSGSFSSAIETLRTSGQRGQEALLGLDGSARSLILFLLQQGPGAIGAFTASLADAQGTAAATARTLNETLKGAFTSFENSLDRIGSGLVKTSLAPLRDELQKLAGELNTFAESRAFTDLQKSLADLFSAGAQAFDNFIQHVDWPTFVESIRDGIRDAAKTIDEFKDDLSSVARAINAIGSTIGVFTRAVAVAFDALKVGVSQTVAIIAGLAAKMSSIQDSLANGGFESAATAVFRSINEEAEKAANEGGDALENNLGKLFDNLIAVGDASTTAAPKIAAIGDSAKVAGEATAAAASDVANAGQDFNAVTGTLEDMASALGILTPSLNLEANAQRAAKSAATEHADAIVRGRQAVADAQAALDKLTQSGNKDVIAFQQASQALQNAQAALDALTGKADSAADSQRALAAAFADLNIKSQSDLQATAERAKKSLDVIAAAFRNGKASAEDVQRAFNSYANVVKTSLADGTDAANQQAQALIDAEAAALGLSPAVADAGAKGKDAGDKTSAAFRHATESLDDASAAASNLASNAADASASVADVGDSAQGTARTLETATQGIVLLTNEQIRGLRAVADELEAGGLTLEQYEQRIQEVMTGTSVALQQQADQLKRLRSTEQDLLSAIAQENGDAIGVENARHEQALENIKDEATLNGELNTIEYAKLRKLEDDLHDLKLKNIRQQASAQQQATDSQQNSNGADSPADTSQAGGTFTGGGAVQRHAIDITVNGKGLENVDLNDPALGKKLTDLFLKTIRTAARGTGLFGSG